MNNKEAIGVLTYHLLHWECLLQAKICDEREGKETIEALKMAIKALEERPTGEWIEDENGIPICSECNNGYNTQPRCMGKPMFEFCPICGAKMKKEAEND